MWTMYNNCSFWLLHNSPRFEPVLWWLAQYYHSCTDNHTPDLEDNQASPISSQPGQGQAAPTMGRAFQADLWFGRGDRGACAGWRWSLDLYAILQISHHPFIETGRLDGKGHEGEGHGGRP